MFHIYLFRSYKVKKITLNVILFNLYALNEIVSIVNSLIITSF